jgi:hypothetical protein
LDSVQDDLKAMDVRNWRQKSKDWDQCRATAKEAKVHHGLKCPEGGGRENTSWLMKSP